MKKTRKYLAILLSLLMMVSLIPSTVFADETSLSAVAETTEAIQEDQPEETIQEDQPAEAIQETQSEEETANSATDTSCLTARTEVSTSYVTTQGSLFDIKLETLFKDTSKHTLTYTLDDGDYGTQTKISDGFLYFTNPTAGTYKPIITATCADGKTASIQLTITVTEAEAGDESQYGYDETDADSVTVYVTVSSDGVPIMSTDGNTVMSHLKVEVPYFDLENQDLTEYYRYKTESGSGEYTSDEIVKRPTALHLYLYILGVYYLGYTPEEVTTGEKKVLGASGEGNGVMNMDGDIAYDDSSNLALNITGSSTSMYMQQFWGHDENLMYYRNHVYPLMSAGWGSTADYILLSDGDTIDVAMFTDWSFYNNGGAFTKFDQDDYTVNAGNTLTFSTYKYDTTSVTDGGTEEFDPVTGLDVGIYDENWNILGEASPVSDDSNSYTYTFTSGGTYYILGRDTRTGEDARYAPATAKVVVNEAFDPTTYYADYDFSSITLDEAGTQYVYNIEESTIDVSGAMNNGEKKLYTVTVPEGTEYVYVTYPSDFDKSIIEYCGLLETDGTENWEHFGDYEYSVEGGNGENYVVKIPVSFLLENNLILAEEDDSYDYFNCFKFVTGDNTKPGSTTTPVAVTGVSLDKDSLTLARRVTETLTATVVPENAKNKTVKWSSSNTDVATVTAKGVVTTAKAGEADITATTADGGFTATCHITVTDENRPTQAEDGYFEISNGAELKWFADEVNDGNPNLNARLVADVDVSDYCSESEPWTPIGTYSANKEYSGTFDGQNHKVSGLCIGIGSSESKVDTSSYYKALFGVCSGATIKNLSVYGTANSMSRYIAGVVGRAWKKTTIDNCHNYVTQERSKEYNQYTILFGFAGIASTTTNATITNCSNEADIAGIVYETGGIVGLATDTTIEKCVNNGRISSGGWTSYYQNGTGGIVGMVRGTINITDCYNTGDVSIYYSKEETMAVGGIVGTTNYTSKTTLTMTNCYNSGKVSADPATKASVGALFGSKQNNSNATVTAVNCYYLDTSADAAVVDSGAAAYTALDGLSASSLGDAYIDSCPSPVFVGMTTAAHTDTDGDKICDVCGKGLVDVADAEISVDDEIYTGEALTPAVTVKVKDTTLTAGTDYEVSYTDNVNVGTATVTITGKGDYAGTATKTFTINAKDAKDAVIADIDDQIYTGSELTPGVTVTDNGKTLTADTDYEVSYTENVNVGTATATVTFKGNYKGTLTKTFTVIARDLKDAVFDDIDTVIYNGEPQTPAVSVTDNGITLIQDKDYEVSYSDNINAGGARIIITGKGNYTGTAETTFVIGTKLIDGAVISDIEDQTYTREEITPDVTVTLEDKELVKDKDYEVLYSDNTNAGTATVTVNGIGNYVGSVTKTFTIKTMVEYVAGDNRWETAAAAAKTAYPEGASTVILVTGNNFPDALTANALAGALDCPILLSRLDSVPEATEELLKEWNNPNIILVGGNWTCEDELNTLGTITERIAGKNRYETAEKVVEYGLEKGLFDTDEVIVATGAKAADALSMSAWAFKYKMPILLANSKGEFTENTQTLLEKFDMVYVAGASSCVKSAALSKAGFAQWKGNMVRLYGDNRYETSYAIARYFLTEYEGEKGKVSETCYAMGLDENYPDALVGGMIAGRAGAPIILVSGSSSADVNLDLTKTVIKNGNPNMVYFLGVIKNEENQTVDANIRAALGVEEKSEANEE